MSTIDFSDPATIAALTEALTAAGVDGIEISGPGGQLRLVISKGEGPHIRLTGGIGTNPANAAIVKAPIAGCFCAIHPSVSEETETLPRRVSDKDVVGFIRIGSVLLPVLAGRSGLLARRLAESGALVGFGDPLFEIEPQP
ncbi:acetyl-CoA carboxylase [Neorhizobium galegae]|uniref:acetyl-CoA carboxylase n=1 Tax=Neorhizobium galegae TaxID=399 RepID=UPI0021020B55|nr:acetyl-CoA carboxylase [Neorhizobium galegae]MCQ1851381.1 acetyl-CoA carboxylase [Neorhizobium galegae]